MNDIVVAKFGGSSLADSDQFKKVKDIILSDENRKIIVPSAPGKSFKEKYKDKNKITDCLITCYKLAKRGMSFEEDFNDVKERYDDICKELNIDIGIQDTLNEIKCKITEGASLAYVASRGEYLNGLILTSHLNSECKYNKFKFIDAAEIIKFDQNGELDMKATELLVQQGLVNMKYAVIPGFYGSSNEGKINIFSRGGSDLTGSIIAKCIGASLYENWTDVSGVLMADPRIVKNPKVIKRVTYKELRELSYMGASVLHEDAVFPVIDEGIPINIRNTNKPEDMGTLIINEVSPESRNGIITGIAGKKDFTVFNLEKRKISDKIGYLGELINIFTVNRISIEHIPTSMDSISVVVSSSNVKNKVETIKQKIIEVCEPDDISIDEDIALVAVVGRNMKCAPGILGRASSMLGSRDINIRIATQGASERNITFGVKNEDLERAIQSLYEEFEGKDRSHEKDKSPLDTFRGF